MIQVNSVNDQYFEINGKNYPRIYEPIKSGSSAVSLISVYKTTPVIFQSIRFDEIEINGTTYTTQNETLNQLLSVTWQGSQTGGNGFYDATVGVGGDYTTHKAAYDSGAKRVLQISNVTENAGVFITDDYFIEGEGFNWSIGGNTIATTGSNITITNLTINNSGILIGEKNFESCILKFEDVIVNLASVFGAYFSDNCTPYFENITFNTPNGSFCKSHFNNGNIDNIILNGGGAVTNEDSYFLFDNYCAITTMTVNGAFNAITDVNINLRYILEFGKSSLLNYLDNSTGCPITVNSFLFYGQNCENIYVTMKDGKRGGNIDNSIVNIVFGDNGSGNSLGSRYSRCLIYMTGYTQAQTNQFFQIQQSNLKTDFPSNVTFNDMQLNSVFAPNSDLTIKGDDNSLSLVNVPTGTITIDASSYNTVVAMCRTITVITDNGDETILSNNKLY